MEPLQAVHQKYITEETSVFPPPPKNLNFGQSAFTWDSDPWQARQPHAVAVSSFFLYAPIFLTYRLEDEPPAGCVFVKHFMTHGLFYNRINCTTIRILVCCGLPPPAYDHTGFLPKLGSEHLYKRSQMELLIWQTAVITESNQSGLVFSLLSSVGTMF